MIVENGILEVSELENIDEKIEKILEFFGHEKYCDILEVLGIRFTNNEKIELRKHSLMDRCGFFEFYYWCFLIRYALVGSEFDIFEILDSLGKFFCLALIDESKKIEDGMVNRAEIDRFF